MTENALALVRDTRKTPAVDSTSAAPPTSDNGDPATVICTTDPVSRPGNLASADAMPFGEVGDSDPLPQAEKSVASVAPDAT